MRYFLLFISFLHFSSPTVYAESIQIPESAKAEIQRVTSGIEAVFLKDVAIGDVDANGIDDVVAIIEYKKSNINLEKLIVLTGTKQQTYSISAQSEAWEENVRSTIGLYIKRSSIYLSSKGSTGLTYFETSYQFKKGKTNFIMIGATKTSGTINGDDLREESFNLLNGKSVIVVIENGKREEFANKLRNTYQITLDKFSVDDDVEFY